MADLVFNFFGDSCIFLKELRGIRLTLANFVALVGVPGASLFLL